MSLVELEVRKIKWFGKLARVGVLCEVLQRVLKTEGELTFLSKII